LYEDTAVDFLGNAKSYVLLLTTAAVAARFNLRYGWDFGGILLPALLGLLWFTPFELALTIGEALVLWAVVGGLLRWSAAAALQPRGGAQGGAGVHGVGGAQVAAVAGARRDRMVGVRPRDLFGFGYLLSSLLALRMLQRKSARQVLLPTLATALVGWVLGSLLGLGFGLVAPVSVVAPAGPQVMSQRLLRTPLGALALGRVQAEMAPPGSPRLGPGLREAHGLAWASLAAWNDGPTPERQEAAREAAGAADLVIAALPGEHGPRASFAVLGAERGFAGGQGLAVLWPGARGMVISVPSPVGEGPVAEAAAVLARAIDARAVLVAERDAAGGEDRHAWALARLAPAGYLELRADEGGGARAAGGARGARAAGSPGSAGARVGAAARRVDAAAAARGGVGRGAAAGAARAPARPAGAAGERGGAAGGCAGAAAVAGCARARAVAAAAGGGGATVGGGAGVPRAAGGRAAGGGGGGRPAAGGGADGGAGRPRAVGHPELRGGAVSGAGGGAAAGGGGLGAFGGGESGVGAGDRGAARGGRAGQRAAGGGAVGGERGPGAGDRRRGGGARGARAGAGAASGGRGGGDDGAADPRAGGAGRG
jgi:hypothetical protein